jgi:DNA polymerase III subunit epsilon
VIDWLERPGVRIVDVVGTWALPVRTALGHVDPAAAIAAHGLRVRGQEPVPAEQPHLRVVMSRTA